MRLCAGQASTKFTFLSRLGATSRAANCQDWFLLDCHLLHNASSSGNKMFNCDHCFCTDGRGADILVLGLESRSQTGSSSKTLTHPEPRRPGRPRPGGRAKARRGWRPGIMTNARWNFARTARWICTPELWSFHSTGRVRALAPTYSVLGRPSNLISVVGILAYLR